MQVADNARQNPTSSSSSTSTSTSITSVDCDSIDKEHSLKRVREEEGEKGETTSHSGGEVVEEVEEKGEKAVEHNSSSSLTGTCTPHCPALPYPFLARPALFYSHSILFSL